MYSKEALRQFARDVAREVCVRAGDHKPASDLERTWAREGVCPPSELHAVNK